ncbi:permease for cytosine/purines, uracil, thiamine, allantoin-domain-containing protein [Lipomyces oligophaga]|uniref:permease for cytosine/purines, uracil, thiamine, allantoin-domain-containing protein n=1 Tax=Lipomyces oligophaga TaxID=45792 RepID=UPI0034CD6374
MEMIGKGANVTEPYGVEEVYDERPPATSSLEKFLRFIEVKDYAGGHYSNADLDPVPPERRTWNWWHYISYWISDNFTPSGWRKAASLVEIGMSWKIALVNVAVAEVIVAMIITINGYIGAKYHISFTVISRSSFGYYFSILMIFMRMVVGTFWYGISTYTGAECVRSMLYAIWPSYRNVPNHLPASAHITTQLMGAYAIYFVTIMPLHYIPIHRIRFLFTVKAITTPIIGFGIMGWTIHACRGKGDLWGGSNTYSGSALGWVFMSGVYSNIAGWATLAVNSPDFTRYAISPRHSFTMAIAMPLTAVLIAFFGVVGAAGSDLLWGTILWDPLLFVDEWTSRGGRAAAFFCAAGFYLAQALANISANSISAANDLNCMLPRFINIRRGQFIVAVVGAWAFTPWNILTSATQFLNFMNAYAIWLAPIAGIMICDFYCVHMQKLDTWALYDSKGIYRYNKYGTNPRALVAWIVGWIPTFPGFLHSVNSNINVIIPMQHLYELSYFYGFGSSFLVYYLLNFFWPYEPALLERGVFVDDVIINARDEEDVVASGDEYATMEKRSSSL